MFDLPKAKNKIQAEHTHSHTHPALFQSINCIGMTTSIANANRFAEFIFNQVEIHTFTHIYHLKVFCEYLNIHK